MTEVVGTQLAQRTRKEPNFFVVGASRAGTTSLIHYLGQHPDVFLPSHPHPKEPSHFCDLTPVWARKYRDPDAYLSIFEEVGDEHAVGEGSTTYLPSPESPWRIRARFPMARIVIVLRNPADRAHSLYGLLCQLGFEWIAPFERALREEDARAGSERFKHRNPFWFYAYQYFRSGLYADQVMRFQAALSPERVKVILFEALRRRPVETTQEVYGFLGVDPTFAPEIPVLNQGRTPLSVPLQYAVARAWQAHPMKDPDAAPGLLDPLLRRVARANLRLGRLRPRRLADSTRRELLRRYAADIRRTAALIGQDLEPWIHGEEVLVA